MPRYEKSFTQPWKNSFVFDNERDPEGLLQVTNTIENAFSEDVFGQSPLYYKWEENFRQVRVDHFKMPKQNRPMIVTGFELEGTIGFSNLDGFLNNGNHDSIYVIVFLWHQKSAFLSYRQGNDYDQDQLYIPIGGFTRNIFSPMMQPYQDLIGSHVAHVDKARGYHNKTRFTVRLDGTRNLLQDDSICVSILYGFMYSDNTEQEYPPVEGAIGLTFFAMS